MLDQDTATALLTIADETGARVALIGDRHQLPAVGRGGVLDHATRWTPAEAQVALDTVHRFSDPNYADLSLLMRTGDRAVHVFDQLHAGGRIVIHPSEVERTAALAEHGASGHTVIADTRDQVADLNGAIRERRNDQTGDRTGDAITYRGEALNIGDRVATRRNDRDLGVANRDTWTITGITADGGLRVTGRHGDRHLPAEYVARHVELAYATTVHGAQGDTVDHAHFALTETTGAAATYVAMTRGRHTNTAHLVATSIDEAREQWIATFNRDRADLGPAHARERALDDIDRYGPTPARPARRRADELAPTPSERPARSRGAGIGF